MIALSRVRCSLAALMLVALIAFPSLPASNPSPPDVSISESDIAFSNDFPKSGENVNITVTVHNIGGMVSGAVTVRFYTDNDLIPFADKTISNIDANATQTTTTNWPATLPRTWTIKVKLNCTADTNNANNEAQRTITVTSTGALTVAMSLDPEKCKPGNSFSVNGTVKQLGNPVSAATVAIMVKPNGASTSVTTDASGAFTATLNAPTTAGKYEVEASATSGSLKGNDTRTLHVVLPDLVAGNLMFSKSSPTEGDTVTLTATIWNNGTDTASNVAVAFYYGSTKIGTKTIDSLQPDNSTTVNINWKTVKGTHDMKCQADPDGKINESKEDNNAVTASLTVKEKVGGGDIMMFIIAAVVIIAVVAVAAVMMMKRKRPKKE